MADTTLRAFDAPSKRADETRQQHADRLLAAHRTNGPDAAQSARDGLDVLEAGSCQPGYLKALTHAVMDVVEDIHGLVNMSGVHRNSNIEHFTTRAINLLSLQMDFSQSASEKISVAIGAWPLGMVQA